jgi:hypothetical protein
VSARAQPIQKVYRRTMTPQTLELLSGIVFFFVAIVGGGFTVKEIEVPKVPTWGRCILATMGLLLIVVFSWGSFLKPSSPLLSVSSPPQPGHGCRRPQNLPSVGDGTYSEVRARDFLTSQGFLEIQTDPAYISGAPKGVVVDQDPPPGTILCPRDRVIIKVTN